MLNTEKTCYVFAAGEYDDMPINKDKLNNSLIVAADGGYSHAILVGVTPQLLVGDFDSLKSIPDNIETVKHPCEKDETDTMLAISEGFKRSCNRFIIYGGLGGRIDHTIANIQLLSHIALNGAVGYLCNKKNIITALHNGSLCFSANYTGIISVFCLGNNAKDVTISGLKYSVKDVELTSGFPLGISNEFLGKEAVISVGCGTLVIIYENKKENQIE